MRFRFAVLFLLILVAFSANSSRGQDKIRVGKITLVFEWIETDLAELQQLPPNSGRSVFDALIEEKRAVSTKTVVLTMRSGSRARSLGVKEYSFPTEFEPPKVSENGDRITKAFADGMETRNLGAEAEVDPIWSPETQTVDVRFNAKFTELIGKRTYGEGICECEVPDFYQSEIVSNLSLRPGISELAASFTPAKGRADFKNPRTLLFVRADVKFSGEAPKIEDSSQKDRGNRRIRFDILETDLNWLSQNLHANGLSTRGPELREKIISEIEIGNATWLDTIFVAGREGQLEYRNGLELMVASDWRKPEVSENGKLVIPAFPQGFDSWELGFGIDAKLTGRGDELRFSGPVSWNSRVGEDRFLEGISEMSFPRMRFQKSTPPRRCGKAKLRFWERCGQSKQRIQSAKNPVIVIFANVDAGL